MPGPFGVLSECGAARTAPLARFTGEELQEGEPASFPIAIAMPSPPRRASSPDASYGTMYGMQKTTVYLPDDLKAALGRVAMETGLSEAELIREGIRLALEQHVPPAPTIPIYVSDDPSFAERVDEHLSGFGLR